MELGCDTATRDTAGWTGKDRLRTRLTRERARVTLAMLWMGTKVETASNLAVAPQTDTCRDEDDSSDLS
jgi:hypothetical protein